ncbi:uncharacterized protein [Rutidosis leptorrhynchoides]|uniref:uncharacterized protein n=1 Tax=Rutidosis leptorrhynchoides TaxID=125765 RepID=UPI003A99F5DC
MSQNKNNKWNLLHGFKTVVKKVTFLMNSNISRWRLVSSFTGGRSFRRLSFGEKLGMTAIVSSSDDEEEEDNLKCCDSGSSSKELKTTKSFRVQRTTTFREEEDVDKRAEMFIENFHRQLRYERQVSLQLRYKRDTTVGSSNSGYQ